MFSNNFTSFTEYYLCIYLLCGPAVLFDYVCLLIYLFLLKFWRKKTFFDFKCKKSTRAFILKTTTGNPLTCISVQLAAAGGAIIIFIIIIINNNNSNRIR